MLNINISNQKNRLVNSLQQQISDTAKKNKWEPYYDSGMDDFFFGSMPVPKNARLMSINDEISLYVTPDYKVSGVFIQYWTTNFLQHNKKEFKDMFEIIRKDTGMVKKTAQKTGVAERYEQALLRHVLNNMPSTNSI